MRSMIGYLVCLIVAATIGFTFAPPHNRADTFPAAPSASER